VLSSGNGWVQIETSTTEVAKRAYELEITNKKFVGSTEHKSSKQDKKRKKPTKTLHASSDNLLQNIEENTENKDATPDDETTITNQSKTDLKDADDEKNVDSRLAFCARPDHAPLHIRPPTSMSVGKLTQHASDLVGEYLDHFLAKLVPKANFASGRQLLVARIQADKKIHSFPSPTHVGEAGAFRRKIKCDLAR
jgi:hypothetical protein